jgi:hypothetical protein
MPKQQLQRELQEVVSRLITIKLFTPWSSLISWLSALGHLLIQVAQYIHHYTSPLTHQLIQATQHAHPHAPPSLSTYYQLAEPQPQSSPLLKENSPNKHTPHITPPQTNATDA